MTNSCKWLFYGVGIFISLTYELQAKCDETITVPLRNHIVPNAIQHFRGNFTDVWASKHVIQNLISPYTEIHESGNTTIHVINKDGIPGCNTLIVRASNNNNKQGFSASGRIWGDDEGIIHIEVEGFDAPGLIFPVYASPKVIAYYSCYPLVEGAGVSVVAARRDTLLFPDTLEHILEAKCVFRRLHEEFGLQINDGTDYDGYDTTSGNSLKMTDIKMPFLSSRKMKTSS